MKILILISEYLPENNPNVVRWSSIANHWTSAGHTVHVLTPKRHDLPAYEEIQGVSVHRHGEGTLLDWAVNVFRLPQKRGRTGGTTTGGSIPGVSSSRIVLEKIVSGTWRKLYWPDGNSIWIKAARRKAKAIIEDIGFDAIITVCYPFSSVLVGRELKHAFPQMRWLIDIEDPFSIAEIAPKNNLTLYAQKNKRYEKACLEEADAISFTNREVIEEYKRVLQPEFSRIAVIPPLWLPVEENQTDTKLDPELIHCAYIGAFYEKVREPEPLVRFLEFLGQHQNEIGRKVLLHFYGSMPPVMFHRFRERVGTSSQLVFHGFRPREEVIHAMSTMDFLVNVGNATAYQLPSKVVDYYASGRPVLNLRQIDNDAFDHFFTGHPEYFSLPADSLSVQGNVENLEYFIKTARSRNIDQERIIEKLEGHSVVTLSNAYLDLLKPRT